MSEAVFTLDLEVRDYECDLQGVVNNAVYQNYLEHARHEFLKSGGVDFAALARDRINLVVVRAELDYRESLTSGDRFTVRTRLRQSSRLKFAFHQDIVKAGSGRVVLEAVVTGVALNDKGRPFAPEALRALMTA